VILSSSAKLRILHIANHAAVLMALYQGAYWILPVGLLVWYAIASFGVSIGFHRYLSHRSFSTSSRWRWFMLSMGVLATGGSPLSWAGAHRLHHLYSDTPRDPHSLSVLPKWKVYFHLWRPFVIPRKAVRDLISAPDVRWLHRNYFYLLIAWAAFWYLINWKVGVAIYSLPATLAFHAFGLINVFGHSHGSRRYPTKDTSTNSWIANLLTAGEGWHNNHHKFPSCYRIGLFSREWDISAFLLEKLPIMKDPERAFSLRDHALRISTTEPQPAKN